MTAAPSLPNNGVARVAFKPLWTKEEWKLEERPARITLKRVTVAGRTFNRADGKMVSRWSYHQKPMRLLAYSYDGKTWTEIPQPVKAAA